jgi:DNA-binding SARP family transcriptional activator/tetratricopeptide (TPR) repeat protein
VETDTITVRLLGGFSVRSGECVLSSLPPQAVSLLSYLVVHRSRPQTRDLLAGRFWSELPEDRARKRLSNCLWQIKRGLADAGLPELVVTTANAVQLDGRFEFRVDAEEFEDELTELEREFRSRQVRSALTDRMAEVVSSYPGDFLAGHYHEWIEPERDRISEAYHSALARLISLYKSRSEYDVALRFAHLLVRQEPLREDLHCEVMRLHALLDQVPAAERQFESCRRILASELGVEPSAETVALLERLRSDAPAPVVTYRTERSDNQALVGRVHEMAVLLGRVDELLSGSGGVVLVEGDPGIGKTRLMREFMEGAEWRGVRVLHAGHTELSRMRPYEALREVLGPTVAGLRGEHLAEVVEPVWLRAAAEILPGLSRLLGGEGASRPLRPDEEPTRVSEALAQVTLAQGGLGPTLLVLEDVHWCDDDSMEVLVQLGSRLARSGVLVCLTYRRFEAEQADSVWSGIGKLESLPSGSRLVVGPLAAAEVRDLIASHLGPGGLPAAAVSRVARSTGGNPLYILESVRSPDALLSDRSDTEDEFGFPLPSTVLRSLETRLSALDTAARSVLETLAALAEPSPLDVVARSGGAGRLPTLEALSAAIDLGFVLDDEEGRVRFSHDQTRRLIYEMMSPARQVDVHRHIYGALLDAGESTPAQLAYHARLAGQMEDTRSWHLMAAREALAINGYRTAADHYGQADEAARDLGIDAVERAKDVLAYEATLDVLGRRSDQAILLKELREVELPLELSLELAEREAWLLINSDEPAQAVEVARSAIDDARRARLGFVPLLAAMAMARYRAGDLTEARETAEESLAEATEVADRIAAHTILGKALVDLLHREEGRTHLAQAVELAERIGDDRGKIEALSYLAVAEFGLGRGRVAETSLTEAIELSRQIGYRWGEGNNMVNLATVHHMQGHGGRALALFNSASEILGSLGYGRVEAIVKYNLAELHHRLLGDDTMAAGLVSSAAVYFRSVGDQPRERVAMALLSSIDRRNGRRRLARRRLTDLLASATANGDTSGEVEVRRVLAALEADTGDHLAAIGHLDEVVGLADRFSLDNQIPNVLANRARSAIEVGRVAVAEADVDRALTLNGAGAETAHLTAWLAGEVLVALGRVDEAVEQFQLAFELLTGSLRGLPSDVVDRSLVAIPEHASIVEEYERRFVQVAPALLPLASAPLGRPLRPDELVDVVWTVSDPSDWELVSAAERRRHRLVRLVGEAEGQGTSVRIADLAGALGVSERTIKRDLADLRASGVNLRTRRAT